MSEQQQPQETAEPTTEASATEAPNAETAPEAGSEVEKWKALARKHEERAKANADAARRLAEIEESQKTEQQKLEDARAAAEKRAADTAAELARMKAVVKYGLTEDDLALLGSGTPEEIEERAEKLAARLKVATPAAPPAAGLGAVGQPIGGGSADLDVQIAEAQKAGNARLVISLNNQKLAAMAAEKG